MHSMYIFKAILGLVSATMLAAGVHFIAVAGCQY